MKVEIVSGILLVLTSLFVLSSNPDTKSTILSNIGLIGGIILIVMPIYLRYFYAKRQNGLGDK